MCKGLICGWLVGWLVSWLTFFFKALVNLVFPKISVTTQAGLGTRNRAPNPSPGINSGVKVDKLDHQKEEEANTQF